VSNLPMHVCLFATFDPRNWSGGRYHALMLAAASAHVGFETHVVANKRAAFADELAALSGQPWQLHEVDDFRRGLPAGDFDFVILVPTGVFLPEFYEAALGFARDRGARVALLNFESANWFNSVAPTKRDPRLWDYWQRACLDGGLVLSSTRTSHDMARQFYHADQALLRFEIWRPPVNSLACQRWDGSPKTGNVVIFIRQADEHKGANELLSIDPAIFAGRTLDVISGTDLTPDFRDRIVEHLGTVVRFHARISDDEKFRLLSAAQALLFPSRFEGYGYPPIEAAFAGTETACYELDVLKETIGSIAHFAQPGDLRSLEAALRTALATAPRQAQLRANVEHFAAFEPGALRLADILLRSREAVTPLKHRKFRVAWGPWAGTKPVEQQDGDIATLEGYLPPVIVSLRRRSQCLLVTIRVSTRAASTTVIPRLGEIDFFAVPLHAAIENAQGWWRGTAYLILPLVCSGQIITIQVLTEDEADEYWLRIDEPPPEISRLPTRAGISKLHRSDISVDLEGWILTDSGASEVWTPDGAGAWQGGALSIHRPDLAKLYPGYNRYKSGFGFSLPLSSRPESGIPLYVLTNGRLDEILHGWPPHPVQHPAELLRVRLWAKPFRVAIMDATDEIWLNGIKRQGTTQRPAAILIERTPRTELTIPGDILELPSGRQRRVVEVQLQETAVLLELDLPISPVLEGSSSGHARLHKGAPAETAPIVAETVARTDESWWNGVWNVRDARYRQGLLVNPSTGFAAMLQAGSIVSTATGTRLRVISFEWATDGLRLWLDRTLTPFGDGAPSSVELSTTATERSTPIFSVPPFKAKDPTYLRLAMLARRDGRDPPDPAPCCATDRARILFLTPVPPFPANQGNRVVTRNFIDHLVDLGFDVDVVLQGSTDLAASPLLWGDRVRFFLVPTPAWAESESAALRRDVAARVSHHPISDADRSFRDSIERSVREFHPLFIVRDETVDLSKSLYRRHAYRYIICNYTHMVRVPIELATIEPLPPVVVVTHDALSRLPAKIGAVKLDTTYRACSPAIEREVLDRLPGAIVVAISAAEKTYFDLIGVTNPIVVCEYDSVEEVKPYEVPIDGFERRTLLFQGSGNPMNVAGLTWFLDSCWDIILEQQPDAILVVCGLVSSHIPPNIPNVICRGDVSRATLLAQMRDASISINPCLAGTGLKIKTVEACCAGLPSVCTTLATEGLEDVQAKFAVVASDAAAFAAGCISLLQDRQRWESLRSGALSTGFSRFSRAAVYREIDAATGWAIDAKARRLSPRPACPELVASERAAIDHPDDPACALNAAMAALRDKDGWGAAVQGGAICAQRPALTTGYQLVAQGLELLQQHEDAADSLLQALALDPDNPRLRDAYCAVSAKTKRPATAFRDHPFLTLPIRLDEPIELNAGTLGWRKPGWGWAGPESWGIWTDGPAARLRLQLDEGIRGPCHFILSAHARAEPGIPAKIAMTADGMLIGRWTWAGGSDARPFTAPLSADLVAQREIVLDLLIGTPRMVERDGKLVDTRRLGLAVRSLIVSYEAPYNAFMGEPG